MKKIKSIFGKDCINVVFACDKNYAPCMTVAVKSLIENTGINNNYDIVILEDGLNFAYKKLITSFTKDYDNISIRFFNIKKYIERYDNYLFTNDYFSLAAYFRILIPEVFLDYEKVIYLDSDVMVMNDVALLYNTELGENLAGVTRDVGTIMLYWGKDDIKDYMDNNLKIPDMKKYFQNGVMLMNLEKMREENFFKKFINTAKSITPPLYFADQDIFNIICFNRVKYINQVWDVVTNTDWIAEHFPSQVSDRIHNEYKNNLMFANIIHYVSQNWKEMHKPYTDIYWGYVSKLPKFVRYDLQKKIIKDRYDISEKEKVKKLFSLNLKTNIAYIFGKKIRDKSEKYYYDNIHEQAFLQDFHKYFARKDFQDKYSALIRNLDEESIKTIDTTIKQINRTKRLSDGVSSVDLYSQYEKSMFKKLDKEFFSKTLTVNENLFRYKNYFLPANYFGPSVFYYKHCIEYINNIDAIKGKCIIDAGASVGDSALIFSELDCDRIYSFEPNNETFDLLNSTIKINMLSKVVPVCLALGNDSTVKKLQLCGSGSTLLEDEHSQDDYEVQDAYVVRLDDYVRQHKLNVGLIKTDLEGFEQEFLQGAEHTIKTQRPILLISLYHKASDYFEIKPMIESWNLGYKFKIVKPLIYNVVNAETMLVAEVNEE